MLSTFTKRIDNAPLIVFRIAFGFLLAWQSFYDIYDNKIYYLYIKPAHLFPFIGFEWLQPLSGTGMYWYYAVMGITALCVSAGFLYRYSLAIFTLLWSGTYLMQKTSYNNHHYLIILLCLLMLLMPANRYASIDARIKPSIKSLSMPLWCSAIIIAQVLIVYFFAAIAKMYPGWLHGDFVNAMFSSNKTQRFTAIKHSHFFHLFIAWGGLLFDLLIIPALLIRRTRLFGLAALLFFHLYNFYTLSIGIFPFLSIAFLPFFFPPDAVRKFFFRHKTTMPENEAGYNPAENRKIINYLLVPYLIVQVLLPMRHYFIKGNVLYTEEGHRLAWRMKLYIKTGSIAFRVREEDGKEQFFDISSLYTFYQIKRMKSKPDMIWQAAQLIAGEYAKKGKKIKVYVTAYVALNNGTERLIIDPDTDLAHAEWNYFGHCPWILLNE